MSGRTVYHVLKETAARCGGEPALYQPASGEGTPSYRVYTWSEYLQAVQEVAAGLRVLGIRKGDIVALASETCAELYLADIGIMTAGAVSAALYTSYPVPDLVRTLGACDARAVFAEDPAMLARLRAAGADSLNVQWLLLTPGAEDDMRRAAGGVGTTAAISLDDLRRMGRAAIAENPGLPARLDAEVTAADYAILYLTSGATGEPKMGLVTHAALVANIDMGPPVLDLTPRDSTIAFLPSAHVTQRVVMELLPLGCGMAVWFSESLAQLPGELERIKPTIFVAPPRLWERVHATIRIELRKRPRAVRRLVESALELGLKAARLHQHGRRLNFVERLLLAAAGRFVFRKMRARFGGQLRVCGSGSAPLGKELAEFYMAIGLPLVEGYGLTEGGVVAMNPLDRPKAGSVGRPLPGVEVRLAEDGELLIRSATLFSGYYKDLEGTAQVLRDGWLKTGDLAEIDPEGYIYITGRKKELIISSNGKKIYPSRIEALFRLEPIVSHVLLIGDRLPYVAVLLTINAPVAGALNDINGWRGRSSADITSAPPVVAEVASAVARVNRNLAPFEQIRKYRILERDFSIEAGELTATLKVRRSRALENFRESVAELYAGRG